MPLSSTCVSFAAWPLFVVSPWNSRELLEKFLIQIGESRINLGMFDERRCTPTALMMKDIFCELATKRESRENLALFELFSVERAAFFCSFPPMRPHLFQDCSMKTTRLAPVLWNRNGQGSLGKTHMNNRFPSSACGALPHRRPYAIGSEARKNLLIWEQAEMYDYNLTLKVLAIHTTNYRVCVCGCDRFVWISSVTVQRCHDSTDFVTCVIRRFWLNLRGSRHASLPLPSAIIKPACIS